MNETITIPQNRIHDPISEDDFELPKNVKVRKQVIIDAINKYLDSQYS